MLISSIFSPSHHVFSTLLTHYHTIPHFDTLMIYSCGKHCEKRRNCLQQAISPFLTMFPTLYGTYFPFYMHFKMSSAICFNLDQSKILSSGNGLNEILFFSYICLVICKCFEFGQVQNFVVWYGVKVQF